MEYLQKQTSFVILNFMNKKWVIVALLLWFLVGACNVDGGGENYSIPQKKSRTIILQPYEGIDQKFTEDIYQRLCVIFSSVQKRNPIPLPSSAFYKARNRYKADTIIKFQQKEVPGNFIMIGITQYDISTSKGEYKDWGVMGLAYRPGNSCVASYYRLPQKDKSSSFFKVVIHELGHAEGLNHCENKTCFMRDAEGKNRTIILTSFCHSCKKTLLAKGWKL